MQQKAQRYLAGRGAMPVCYFLQYLPTGCVAIGETRLAPKRAVGDHGDAMRGAPGNHRVFNGSLF